MSTIKNAARYASQPTLPDTGMPMGSSFSQSLPWQQGRRFPLGMGIPNARPNPLAQVPQQGQNGLADEQGLGQLAAQKLGHEQKLAYERLCKPILPPCDTAAVRTGGREDAVSFATAARFAKRADLGGGGGSHGSSAGKGHSGGGSDSSGGMSNRMIGSGGSAPEPTQAPNPQQTAQQFANPLSGQTGAPQGQMQPGMQGAPGQPMTQAQPLQQTQRPGGQGPQTPQSVPGPGGGEKPGNPLAASVRSGWASLRPSSPSPLPTRVTTKISAAMPQPGLTANQPMPPAGMGAPPPMAAPTVAAQMNQPQPISPQASPGLAAGDPATVAQAQQMGMAPPPGSPGAQMAPPPGDPSQGGQPGGPPPAGPGGGPPPAPGNTAPMQDPVPPPLPINPRPNPPLPQPTDFHHQQASEFTGLLDQKNHEPATEAADDLKSQSFVGDVKVGHLLRPIYPRK